MANQAINRIILPNGDICVIIGVPYGVCSTAAATQEKEITINNIPKLFEGLSVRVKFTNAQTYNGTPTLNLNSLGAKTIKRNGNKNANQNEWGVGEVLDMVYDGTSWIIVNGGSLKVG